MKRRLGILVVLAALLAAGQPASRSHAQDGLDAVKSQGLVGERPDGLVGAVADTVQPQIRDLIERVNAQRLERYREIARTNGTSVGDVQALAGRRLIDRTPKGQFVMTAQGRWVRR
jgi:uncharacterized protein YdbL (DUF1318 family)